MCQRSHPGKIGKLCVIMIHTFLYLWKQMQVSLDWVLFYCKVEDLFSFMSKALTDMQSRYSNIEREILGIVTGIKHFHQYLFGRQFMLYTDHKPIGNLVLKPLVDTSPRVQRLMLHLSQYNMKVVLGTVYPNYSSFSDKLSSIQGYPQSTCRNMDRMAHV